MAPSIPNGIPAALVAGTTWKWSVAPGDFPVAEGWAVEYRLAGAGFLEAVADVVGDAYVVTVLASATADFVAGTYSYRALASKAGEVYLFESGRVDVAANPSASTQGDLRSFAVQMLQKVEAEIGARFGTSSTPLGSAHESYTIGGRNITKISIADLQVMRARLSMEVERERNGGVLPPFEAGFQRPDSKRRGPFRGDY